MKNKSKYLDALIGFAIGDAFGVPLEFYDRSKLQKNKIDFMLGYGSHDVPAGSWSDDTSMTIATMDSFIDKNKFDYEDIMSKWVSWIEQNKYTPTNSVFGIGRTTLFAIRQFTLNIEPLKCGLNTLHSNGNGSLMRMLPVALYSYEKKLNDEEIINLTNDMSTLTHAHEISRLACYIYVRYIINLLNGDSLKIAYNKLKKIDYSSYSKETIELFNRILVDDISKLKIDDIKSSGYVIDTLEASLWSALTTKNYKDSIVNSVSLGDDTDTIAAITGSMTGIYYKMETFPKEWLDTLLKKDLLIDIANEFEKSIKNN